MTDTIDLDETLAQSLEAIAEAKGQLIDLIVSTACRQAAALIREQAVELDRLTAERVDKSTAWDEISKKNEIIRSQASRVKELDEEAQRKHNRLASLYVVVQKIKFVCESHEDDSKRLRIIAEEVARALLDPEVG